jgi:hypothetical protein
MLVAYPMLTLTKTNVSLATIEVVGPMPVNLFLETFLPYRTRIPQFEDVSFSGIPDEPDRESVICASLVRRENPTSRGTFSHVILKETT